MTECEKMRREEFYDFTSEECLASYYRAKHICAKLQTMTTEDKDYRKTIENLIPGIPQEYVDLYGYGTAIDVMIDNRKIKVLPLAHPRQIGALGAHSEKWNRLHQEWDNNLMK